MEELPAAYLNPAIDQLRTEATRLFEEAHLDVKAVESFGTPRRLVLIARQLASIQRHPPEEIRGPSKQAAFDAQGKPTAALTGFLRARGGNVSQIKIVSMEKGDYVYLVKPARSTPTLAVLPRLIQQAISRLRFPKTMRWDDSQLRFARPIRWLVASYGTTPIRVSAGRLTSRPLTWLGRVAQRKAVAVRDSTQLLAALKRSRIVVDQHARRRTIEQLVKRLAARQGGRAAPEMVTYGLLDEVTALVEEPVAMVGQFNKTYLSLPREVLLASMAKHQRVFAIQTAAGKLLPRFVAILDGRPRQLPSVQRVYEHILNARLADSLLFWEQDRKRLPLDQLAQRLQDVVFHERLGSMADKSIRLERLGEALAETWGLAATDRADLGRAARLAKADLVTTMVKEFPTLQGVVGKYYAKASGESDAVAMALEEQYLPQGDRLPKTLIGSALALVEKFDTLVGYFGLGIEPSGDEDPFGLRRCAQGIIEIVWPLHRPLPLTRLLEVRLAFPPFTRSDHTTNARVTSRITQYLSERLYTFNWPPPIPSRDLIDAVLSSRCEDLTDAMDRIQRLRQLDGKNTLLKAAKVVERTHNILKGASLTQTDVDHTRFQEPLERRLWERYHTSKDRIDHLIRQKAYAEATEAYGEAFFDVLHEFFDQVLVNVKDPLIQQNRLALMRTINALYTERVADLSRLSMLQRHQEDVSP